MLSWCFYFIAFFFSAYFLGSNMDILHTYMHEIAKFVEVYTVHNWLNWLSWTNTEEMLMQT